MVGSSATMKAKLKAANSAAHLAIVKAALMVE